MTDEEIYKIIMKVEGEEKIKALKIALEQQEKVLIDNIVSFGKLSAQAKQTAASIGQLQGQLKQAGGGAQGAGQLMMQAGYAADDLQYGFKGIANNIQPILSSIPALAKLAGPISIAAIAAYQLYEHWDLIAKIFGAGHVKTQAEEMEELRKKTSLTADEAERLARASNLEGKVKELRGAKTADQKATEDAATKAMVEAGAGNVARGILATAPEMVDGQGEAVGAKKKLDDLQEQKKAKLRLMDNPNIDAETQQQVALSLAGIDDKLIQAEKDLLEARKKTAEQIAATGALPADWPGNRAKVADLARKNPAAFGGGDANKGLKLAGALDAADPARMKAEAEAASEKAQDEHHQARIDEVKNRELQFMADAAKTEDEKDAEEEKEAQAREDKINNRREVANEHARAEMRDADTKAVKEGRDAQDELYKDAMKRPEYQQRHSQIIGAANLASSIQSAVGGKDDSGKMTVTQLIRSNELLEKIANGRQAAGRQGIGFNAQGNLAIQ